MPEPTSSIHTILFRLLLELLCLVCALCYLRIRQLLSRLWWSLTKEWRVLLRVVFSRLLNSGDTYTPLSAPVEPHPNSGPPSTALELSSRAITKPQDHCDTRRPFFRIPNGIKSFNIFVSWLNNDDLGGKGVSLQLNANYSDRRPSLFQDDFHELDWLDCLNVRQRL